MQGKMRKSSVFSAGENGRIDLDDLGLKKTYSLRKAAVQGRTYNDLMVEVSPLSQCFVFCSHVYRTLLCGILTLRLRTPTQVVCVHRCFAQRLELRGIR